MPQSLAKNLIHLVFSTKDRRPLIDDAVRENLHNYAGGILRDLESPALLMNSVSDHIHVLFNLHRTKALSDVVMELKRGTSQWMKEQGPQHASFYWQSGFGAFSVSQSNVKAVEEYIAKQAEHHAVKTFQEEFRDLLKRYEVEFDERYVWD
jgi:REP element-mobilizing transposase RayT